MHCSCRAAPLRTFINGLAQVHRLESFATTRSHLSTSQSKSCLQELAIARHSRQPVFHQSRFLSSNAVKSDVTAAQAAKTEKPEHTATSSNPSSPIETHSYIIETPSSNNPGFKKKGKTEVRGTSRVHTNKTSANPSEKFRSQTGNLGRNLDRAKHDSSSFKRRGNYSGTRTGARSKFDQQTDPNSTQAREQKPGQRKPSRNIGESSSASQTQDKDVEPWKVQKERLKAKFPEGWKPIKRLSPDALAGIRALNAQFPDVYTTENLAAKFEVSIEHIRRILKSHWQPTVDEEQARQERWHRRGMQIWETKAALGVKPPRKWRSEGITRDPRYHDRRRARIQRDKLWEEEETNKYKAYREGLKKAAGKVV